MTIIHRTVAAVLALGVGGTAFAQQAGDSPTPVMEEVHVTGSRIQVSGMTTPTPVTSLSVNDLHVMAPTTLAAAITQLPQFTNSAVPEGAPSSGWTGASGASILNLRGVGQNRTLVLLDGRRVVASTRKGTLDVNLLPDSLVKNVEVVTGGASAAYGSDAVSGVVNFILDNKFEGLKSDIQGGVTELGDNKNYTVSLAGGMALGERTHLIAAVDYYSADPITDATRRDWQQSQGVLSLPSTRPAGTPARITRSNLRSTQFTEGGLITAVSAGVSPTLQWTQFLPGGVNAPFAKSTQFFDPKVSGQVGGDGQDLSWYNYFTPDTSRGSAFAHLTFDLSDHASVFLQGLYGLGDTSYLSPPSGGQFQTWAPTIYWNNAFLPADVAAKMPVGSSFTLGRAGDLDYGGSKTIEQENILKSVTTGLKMDIGDWKLDGYYQYGRTDSNINMNGAIRLDRIYQAIDAVKDTSGKIVCRSTLTTPGNGCVPLNIFGVGSPSQAAIDWIRQDISQKQIVEENVADVAISGSPFNDWAGPVTMAVGAAWREETFTQAVYPVELHALDMPTTAQAAALGYRGLPGVYSGNPNIFERGPSAAPSGGYKVKEAFTEMQFPLLAEKPLARALDLNMAVRLADYEGSGNMWAWKGGIDWSLNDQVRFRLTRSRDVRAGTLSERFDTSRGPGNVVEQGGTSYAISVIADGNPNVAPEKADTLTFGVVYQPSWLDGFGASIDAFDVKVADAIGQLGAQGIVDQCAQGATQLCNYIQRGTDGKIAVIVNTFINTAQARAKGTDVELSYARPVAWFGGDGRIRTRLLASYVKEVSTQQVGAAKVDRAGQTGLQGGAPDWQGSVYFTYERGPLSATLQERYINSGKYDATFVQGVDIDDNSVASFAMTNLELSYRGDLTTKGTWQTYLNVQNLFDKQPPLVATWGFTGSTQTNTSLFDIYGRRYNLGVRFNF